MFSIADMAVAGAVALLLFGPDQLPKVARRAGQLVRDVQNTSQSFIREMERAADSTPDAHSATNSAAAYVPSAPLYHETPEPADHALVARETALETRLAGDETVTAATDPQTPASTGGSSPAGAESTGRAEAATSAPSAIRPEHVPAPIRDDDRPGRPHSTPGEPAP